MPNWCRNELNVRFDDFMTPEPEREEFLEALRESIVSFARRIQRAAASDRKDGTRYYVGREHKRKPLDFNNFIPYPEKYAQRDQDYQILTQEQMREKYGDEPKEGFLAKWSRPNDTYVTDGFNNGGYEWCIDNWGTKWNASNAVWVGEHSTLYFDTPWGPVFPILSEIHKRFPRTHICYEYYEGGQEFMGGCEFIQERYFDKDCDIPMGKEQQIEMSMKLTNAPIQSEWQAGQPYNFWTAEYKGYKGG